MEAQCMVATYPLSWALLELLINIALTRYGLMRLRYFDVSHLWSGLLRGDTYAFACLLGLMIKLHLLISYKSFLSSMISLSRQTGVLNSIEIPAVPSSPNIPKGCSESHVLVNYGSSRLPSGLSWPAQSLC